MEMTLDITFTDAAANGGLLFAGFFAAMFLYVFITDGL
tara:strand:+ start:526 stop:639 length:114 start_codon:yes stop_codon:yes gene_type:complete